MNRSSVHCTVDGSTGGCDDDEEEKEDYDERRKKKKEEEEEQTEEDLLKTLKCTLEENTHLCTWNAFGPFFCFEASTEAGSARTDADETAASAGEVEEANSRAVRGVQNGEHLHFFIFFLCPKNP